MSEDLLDWDAFEKMEKRLGAHIPAGTVSVHEKYISFGNFSKHISENYMDVFYQPNMLLLVPTKDEGAYTISKNGKAITVTAIISKLKLKARLYPAKWVKGKGLLIDLRQRQPTVDSDQGLEAVFSDG